LASGATLRFDFIAGLASPALRLPSWAELLVRTVSRMEICGMCDQCDQDLDMASSAVSGDRLYRRNHRFPVVGAA
jgi:hypothetical protein